MPTTDVRTCSIARTLEVVGEKWSLLAVRELMLGNHRFEEIVSRTGAPRDILTTRLRKLEENGLVERRQYTDRPPRFEYHLTTTGKSLMEVVLMLREWGDEHLAGPDGPPALFSHSCGEILHAKVTCAACGEQLRGRDITLVD
jgi:DNA-binding HxlR family transcriptional regulator